MATPSQPSIGSITDSVPVGIAHVGLDLRYTFANTMYEAIVGLPRDRVVGSTVPEILGPAYEKARPYLERAFAGEDVRYRLEWPVESTRQVDVRYVADRDESNGVRGVYVLVTDVTEQLRAEELFRVLFERSTAAHLVFGRGEDGSEGTTILACNAAAVAMLRADDETELVGRDPVELSPERQADGRSSAESAREMEEVARREGHHRFEWTYRRRDGGEFPCEVTLSPVMVSSGPALLVTWHDISQRRQLALERERHRREMQLILDHLPAFVWFKDTENNILRVNQPVADSLGVPVEEIEGAPTIDLYPDEAEAYHQDDLVVIASGKPRLGIIEPLDTPSGKRWVRTDKIPLHDEHGDLTRILVVSRDITDLKQAEAALAESETKFRGIFHQTFQFIGLMTTDGTLTDANRSSLEAAGVAPEDVLGKPFWETPWWAHSEELREQLRDAVRRAATGEFVRLEATHPVADGSLIHVDFSLKPILDEDGNVAFLIPEGRDITDRKRAEDALAATSAELARSNQDLQQFAYVASHDLRAPLRNIAHVAQWIDEDGGELLGDTCREHVDRIRNQCTRMEALLNGLLEYSRAGSKRYGVETVDTGELLAETISMLQVPEGFRIEWPDGMPTLESERSPLQRVFLNLVGNAIKHHDRPDGRVQIAFQDVGDWVRFTVSDDGPGIEARFHARVFELFRKLKSRDEVEGSGMGLSIVERLVERHGGRIILDSEPGEGATFVFTWPRRTEPTDDADTPSSSSAVPR